jgi:hypothetical protein
MSNRAIFSRVSGLALGVFFVTVGCQTLHNAGVPGLDMYVKRDPAEIAKEESHREQFAVHRDHKSFYWLLANKVSNGMSLPQVEEEIGEPGEHTTEFNMLKSDGIYQTTDNAYRWGPDNKGFSAIIFFRDNHVVGFNGSDYETP